MASAAHNRSGAAHCAICDHGLTLQVLLETHKDSLPNYPSERDVRRKAYDLWEQAGRPEGQLDVHWEAAKRALYVGVHEARGRVLGICHKHFTS